jgi:glycosyltransferase involved in cell wall biosynthesis
MYLDLPIAVVMPVYNEQDHVGNAVLSVPPFVDLIVVVDDGSTDATWSVLSEIADARLRILRHPVNRGVGSAIKTGYQHCLTTSAKIIAIMDGDGQMDGGDLPKLLDRVAGGADFVKGNRFLDASIGRMPFLRWIGNSVLSGLTRAACGIPGGLDSQCGYSAISRMALAQLDLASLYNRYGFHNEMLFLCRRSGLTIDSVPVTTVYRNEVSHINPFIAVPTILLLIARGYLNRLLTGRKQKYLEGTVPEPVSAD